MNKRTLAFVLAVLLAAAGQSPALANLEAAVKYYSEGQFALAFREFQRLAEKGEVAAQTALARMYRNGEGVTKDDARAAEWYRRAAETGDPEAQNGLGFLYETGRGVEQDEARAAEWYWRAAERGHAPSQTSLGLLYATGRGVRQDHATARRWYRRAADQGFARAQHLVGKMYVSGPGDMPVDYVQAYAWLTLAANQGLVAARQDRDQVAEYMSFEQIRQARELASKWRPQK